MLRERKVNTLASTWDKELSKVIHDQRYRLIPQQYRQMIYEEFVKA